MKFACGMVVSAMADRICVTAILSRDRKWPRVTKCMHSQVVGLSFEGILLLMFVDR